MSIVGHCNHFCLIVRKVTKWEISHWDWSGWSNLDFDWFFSNFAWFPFLLAQNEFPLPNSCLLTQNLCRDLGNSIDILFAHRFGCGLDCGINNIIFTLILTSGIIITLIALIQDLSFSCPAWFLNTIIGIVLDIITNSANIAIIQDLCFSSHLGWFFNIILGIILDIILDPDLWFLDISLDCSLWFLGIVLHHNLWFLGISLDIIINSDLWFLNLDLSLNCWFLDIDLDLGSRFGGGWSWWC